MLRLLALLPLKRLTFHVVATVGLPVGPRQPLIVSRLRSHRGGDDPDHAVRARVHYIHVAVLAHVAIARRQTVPGHDGARQRAERRIAVAWAEYVSDVVAAAPRD